MTAFPVTALLTALAAVALVALSLPVSLIAIGLAEAGGIGPELLWSLGGAAVAGRLLHAVGMLRGSLPPRALGMIVTYLTLLAAAGVLVCTVISKA